MSSQRQRDSEKTAEARRLIVSSASGSRESGTAAQARGAVGRRAGSTAGASPLQRRLLFLLAALGTLYLIWGSTYLGIRIAIDTIPPLLMASTRFAIAGALLCAWSVRRGDTSGDRPGRSQWMATSIVGVLLLAGGNGGVTWGEQFVPTGIAALLVASVPLWMVLFAHFTGDDRLSWPVAVGLGLGVVGVALLVQPSGGAGHLLGPLPPLGPPISWAPGSVHAPRPPLPRRPLVSTGQAPPATAGRGRGPLLVRQPGDRRRARLGVPGRGDHGASGGGRRGDHRCGGAGPERAGAAPVVRAGPAGTPPAIPKGPRRGSLSIGSPES